MAENYEGLNFEGFAHKKTAEYIKKKYDKVFSTREEREDPLYHVLTVQYKAGNIILIIAFVGWIFLLLIYLFG